jgi:hypothetical protein
MATWAVQSMMVKTQESGQSDVVYLVDWLASDTDGVNEARRGGQTEIPAPTGTFVPYDQLTEQQVLDWVWAQIGSDAKTAIETNLNMQIVYMQQPPVVSLPLPWG